MRLIPFKFFFLFLLSAIAWAQTDTSRVKHVAADTMEIRPVKNQLFWYDKNNALHEGQDTTHSGIFRIQNEKAYNYRDFSDLFRESALWFYYDLQESGRPAYVAPLNLYPHQTAFYYNGIFMNDPVIGMFNAQFIPVNFTKNVEVDETLSDIQSFGLAGGARIRVTPNSIHPDNPWTKIVFKQGSFSFSILDISFAQSFSDKFSIQLGGFNNLYDGTLITASQKGNNFHGEIAWQYAENLFIRSQFYLNRHRVGLAQYELQNKVLRPLLYETRDDYFLDLTWLPDSRRSQIFHGIVFYTDYFRSLRDEDPVNKGYYLEYGNDRLGFDANYRLIISPINILLGGGALHTTISGPTFDRPYQQTASNVYTDLQFNVTSEIQIFGKFNISFLDDFDPQFAPTAGIQFNPAEEHHISATASSSNRFPNVSERFYSFDSLTGNPNVKPEEHRRVTAEYKIEPNPIWHLKISAGWHQVENEINWDLEKFFNNSATRNFSFGGLELGFSFWKFTATAAGQYTFADINITPVSSVWGKLHFHDRWLKGALLIDAYGTAQFFDEHRDIFFDPRLDRFAIGDKMTSGYTVLNWKAVATIQEARIFFEMDNSLSENYLVIRGYNQLYIHWRFGINWILWD